MSNVFMYECVDMALVFTVDEITGQRTLAQSLLWESAAGLASALAWH